MLLWCQKLMIAGKLLSEQIDKLHLKNPLLKRKEMIDFFVFDIQERQN